MTYILLVGSEEDLRASRVLMTMLFTDIVGSTEHAMKVGDARWRQVLNEHEHLVRCEVEAAAGRVVDMIGDGSMSAFDAPARAIRCAKTLVAGARGLGFEIRAGDSYGSV